MMVTPLSTCSNVFPGLPEFVTGLAANFSASRVLTTPRHVTGANRFVAVRGDLTEHQHHCCQARVLAQTGESLTAIAFEDMQLSHPDQIDKQTSNFAAGFGTIVMRCPTNTVLVGDDVGWGHATPKPPAATHGRPTDAAPPTAE